MKPRQFDRRSGERRENEGDIWDQGCGDVLNLVDEEILNIAKECRVAENRAIWGKGPAAKVFDIVSNLRQTGAMLLKNKIAITRR